MSDTRAAIRAAHDVQADSIAPELYRQATEWYVKARHEYRFKNFEEAKEDADQARHFAEEAEFEAIRNGGVRTSDVSTEPPPPGPSPYPYPTPTGTPADVYAQRKAAADAAQKQAQEADQKAMQIDTSNTSPGSPGTPQGSNPAPQPTQ